MAEFSEPLKDRRAIRDYSEEEVDVQLILEIIEGSTLAPNSGNRQPWRFLIIDDEDLMKRISDESKRIAPGSQEAPAWRGNQARRVRAGTRRGRCQSRG